MSVKKENSSIWRSITTYQTSLQFEKWPNQKPLSVHRVWHWKHKFLKLSSALSVQSHKQATLFSPDPLCCFVSLLGVIALDWKRVEPSCLQRDKRTIIVICPQSRDRLATVSLSCHYPEGFRQKFKAHLNSCFWAWFSNQQLMDRRRGEETETHRMRTKVGEVGHNANVR